MSFKFREPPHCTIEGLGLGRSGTFRGQSDKMLGQIAFFAAAFNGHNKIVSALESKSRVRGDSMQGIKRLPNGQTMDLLEHPEGFDERHIGKPDGNAGTLRLLQLAANYRELARIVLDEMTDEKVGVPSFHPLRRR